MRRLPPCDFQCYLEHRNFSETARPWILDIVFFFPRKRHIIYRIFVNCRHLKFGVCPIFSIVFFAIFQQLFVVFQNFSMS